MILQYQHCKMSEISYGFLNTSKILLEFSQYKKFKTTEYKQYKAKQLPNTKGEMLQKHD